MELLRQQPEMSPVKVCAKGVLLEDLLIDFFKCIYLSLNLFESD